MAHILAINASGRPKGFTAGVLDAAIKGMESVPGVEVEKIRLHKYKFGPCNSCFSCIRNDPHECILKDDMGLDGELMAKIKQTNGLFISDPVHCWGTSAACHLFIERLYPFLWNGELEGMPFGSASCASNQGMQRLANANLCKWAFTFGMRYQGGLPIHTTYLERAHQEVEQIGRRLGEAAMVDVKGREKFPDPDRYRDYLDKPWSVLEPYLDNLTNGTMTFEGSLMAEGLTTFKRDEAIEVLKEAAEVFQEALRLYGDGRIEDACGTLSQASALWTQATWKEFLETDVIKSAKPAAYRPVDGQSG